LVTKACSCRRRG